MKTRGVYAVIVLFSHGIMTTALILMRSCPRLIDKSALQVHVSCALRQSRSSSSCEDKGDCVKSVVQCSADRNADYSSNDNRWVCYLLVELLPDLLNHNVTASNDNNDANLQKKSFKYGRRTYIGATVDVIRRLRQHNREVKGGAKYTSNGRWMHLVHVTGTATRLNCLLKVKVLNNCFLLYSGFPNQRAALQFEWKWKHLSRRMTVSHQREICRDIDRNAKSSIATYDVLSYLFDKTSFKFDFKESCGWKFHRQQVVREHSRDILVGYKLPTTVERRLFALIQLIESGTSTSTSLQFHGHSSFNNTSLSEKSESCDVYGLRVITN